VVKKLTVPLGERFVLWGELYESLTWYFVDAAMKNSTMTITILMGLLLFSAIAVENQSRTLAIAQPSETILIKDDGSIEGTNKIQRNENTYTFTGNISGNLQVRKGNIVIDGAGFTLNGNNGTGIAISSEATEHPSELDILNVTVRNLRITNFKWGIKCDFGGNHTFYGNYISNDFVTQNGTGNFSWDNLGILFWGGSGNNITHCTIGGSPAIYMHFVTSNNFVIENNIVFGADLRMSGIETFDGNYWSDYSIKYPNASGVDSSGVWNMPYVLADSSFENRKFQDSRPLVNPIIIPNFQKTLPIVKSVQEPSSIPIIPIALGIVVTVLIVLALLIFWKKHKERKQS
jgi:hypothetical protein